MTKFNSLRDEVVYRASLDGTADETCGSVQEVGFHASLIIDFYGVDYIVIEDSQGFVEVEGFAEHIEVSAEIGEGYYCPVTVKWMELEAAVAASYEDDA